MPFIHTKTNRSIAPDQEKRLAQALGEAIGLLNKSEKWLMLQFEGDLRLYFAGDDQAPQAIVQVQLLGGATAEQYQRLTEKITQIIGETLAIAPDKVYVVYGETDYWGWNGSNF